MCSPVSDPGSSVGPACGNGGNSPFPPLLDSPLHLRLGHSTTRPLLRRAVGLPSLQGLPAFSDVSLLSLTPSQPSLNHWGIWTWGCGPALPRLPQPAPNTPLPGDLGREGPCSAPTLLPTRDPQEGPTETHILACSRRPAQASSLLLPSAVSLQRPCVFGPPRS